MCFVESVEPHWDAVKVTVFSSRIIRPCFHKTTTFVFEIVWSLWTVICVSATTPLPRSLSNFKAIRWQISWLRDFTRSYNENQKFSSWLYPHHIKECLDFSPSAWQVSAGNVAISSILNELSSRSTQVICHPLMGLSAIATDCHPLTILHYWRIISSYMISFDQSCRHCCTYVGGSSLWEEHP